MFTESVEVDINTSLPDTSLLTTDTHSAHGDGVQNTTLGDITLEDHSYFNDASASSESNKIGRVDDGSSLSEVGSGGTMQANEMLLLDDTLPENSDDEADNDKLLCSTAPTADSSDDEEEQHSQLMVDDQHSVDSLEESMGASVQGEIDPNISGIIDQSIKTGALNLDDNRQQYPYDADGVNSVQASQALSALLAGDTVAGGKTEYTNELSALLRDEGSKSVAGASTIGGSSVEDPELSRLSHGDSDSDSEDGNAPKIMIDTSKYFKSIGAETRRGMEDEDESRYTISPDGSKTFDKFGSLAGF